MDILPLELVEIIFSHINAKPDILSSRQVSKKWKCYAERFVRTINPSLNEFRPVNSMSESLTELRLRLFHSGIGKYKRFSSQVFHILPHLKSINTDSEIVDLPLVLDDFFEILDIVEQTRSESLDIYLVKYPDIMSSEQYHNEIDHLRTREQVHSIAKLFFVSCFEFLRRYCGSHGNLSFSARCDVPYSSYYPNLERITFRYLQGTLIISGIDVPSNGKSHMRHFRDGNFMTDQLKSISQHIKALSTWFLRFERPWSFNLFPYLSTINVYCQTFDMKVFSILAESPTIDSLIHTYRDNVPDRYIETDNISYSISHHINKLGPVCLKPTNLVLPFAPTCLGVIFEKFPNIRAIGLINNSRRFSHNEIFSGIEKIYHHGIRYLRIYTKEILHDLPLYSDLRIEHYMMTERW